MMKKIIQIAISFSLTLANTLVIAQNNLFTFISNPVLSTEQRNLGEKRDEIPL